MARKYPEVKPGGSLILAWQIKDKKVLVVGGGEVRQANEFRVLAVANLTSLGPRLLPDGSSTASTPMPT
jgi:precorrin-2 dehydrogenase/sirohydrochlorin ferrochelatase